MQIHGPLVERFIKFPLCLRRQTTAMTWTWKLKETSPNVCTVYLWKPVPWPWQANCDGKKSIPYVCMYVSHSMSMMFSLPVMGRKYPSINTLFQCEGTGTSRVRQSCNDEATNFQNHSDLHSSVKYLCDETESVVRGKTWTWAEEENHLELRRRKARHAPEFGKSGEVDTPLGEKSWK